MIFLVYSKDSQVVQYMQINEHDDKDVINTMDNNHMVISTDVKCAFNKSQCPLTRKIK